MKLLKLTIWLGAVVLAGTLAVSQVFAHADHTKVNICHHASDHLEAIQVDASAFDGQGDNDHTKHNDFLYLGPLKENGHPLNNDWCNEHPPVPPVTGDTPPIVEQPPVTTVTPPVQTQGLSEPKGK